MTFDEHYTHFMETEHARAIACRPSWDDFSINFAERSLHFVEGHKTKADNPHVHRLSTMGENGALKKLSPYVEAWLKTFDEPELSPEDAEIAARLAQLPEPSWLAPMLAYRTHAQRMAEMYRAADKANKNRPPLTWRPIPEEQRAELLTRYEWKEQKHRDKSTAAARKRGDIILSETDGRNV